MRPTSFAGRTALCESASSNLLDSKDAPVLPHAPHEDLRRSERLLRSIFDGALDAMLLADGAGKSVLRDITDRVAGEEALAAVIPGLQQHSEQHRGAHQIAVPALRFLEEASLLAKGADPDERDVAELARHFLRDPGCLV